MQWIIRWHRRARHLWLLVKRRFLGLLPLFGVDPSKRGATATKPPFGRVAPGSSYLDHFVRSGAALDHPVVNGLRRKATNELFDWLGLVMIPQQTWAIVAKVGDPGAAIEQLIRALGCDPLRARRREADEIARLETAVDVLIALDVLRPHLSEEHLSEIEYLLFDGDYNAVKIYSRIVSALSAVVLGREKSKTLRRFAAYESFVRAAEDYLADPWSLGPGDADEALGLSDRFITAMERYTVLYGAISRAIRAIRSLWTDGSMTEADADYRDGIFLQFEDIDDALVADSNLDLADIDNFLNDCADLLEDCRNLLEHLEGDSGESGGPSEPASDEVDLALIFFGFATGSSPSWEAINKAYKTVMKKCHTDLAAGVTDPEEIVRREELTKSANMHRDFLRRRYPGAR